MTNKKKKALIVAVLAALLCAAAIMMGIRRDPGKALLNILSDRVDLQVRNVHYTEVGDSGMKWEITADTARYQKKENMAFFDTLSVRLVTKDGKTFLMTGDRGRFNTESRDIEVEGNVGIVSEDGARFTTERLRYRNAEKVMETDRPVTMENGRVRVSGVGMILSLDKEKITILSQVRARSDGGMRGIP